MSQGHLPARGIFMYFPGIDLSRKKHLFPFIGFIFVHGKICKHCEPDRADVPCIPIITSSFYPHFSYFNHIVFLIFKDKADMCIPSINIGSCPGQKSVA